jgi:GNAT superfamily N-acetyltransferase
MIESGMGLPHSKTLARGPKCNYFREVLECDNPMPFWIYATSPTTWLLPVEFVPLASDCCRHLNCGMEFSINQIIRDEVPDLLELVRELARFEKLEHEVEATVGSLTDSLFGPKPVAGALIGRVGKELAGYALYFFTFSSFIGRPGIWLEDLYVRPEFRRQGLGRAMIETVASIGADRNCGRFEWTALNWNENALDFYRKLGAQMMNEWVLVRVNAEGLRRLGARKV